MRIRSFRSAATTAMAALSVSEAAAFCASRSAASPARRRSSSSSLSPLSYSGGDVDTSEVPDVEITPEEHAFFDRTSELCSQRNLPLAGVKNARDLATVSSGSSSVVVQPGRIYRTGRLSDASDDDIALLFDTLGVRTLVDLRSPTELKDDPTLEREAVFKDFVSVVWKERGRDKDGDLKELKPGQARIKCRVDEEGNRIKGKSKREQVRELLDGVVRGAAAAADEVAEDFVHLMEEIEDDQEVLPAPASSLAYSPPPCDECEDGKCRPERHFVSIMNELKYVRGTLRKLRKRDIARALIHSPGAVVSRRARSRVKDVFLSEINGGGLPLLNELLLRYGAPGIKYVLELCADRDRHPVAFYCTAGKDRTGVIAAIILSACGVADEDIVEDYSLSANVYAQMNDHKAMVGALSQRNLDAKTFLGAPPQVMRDTLDAIRADYGSVEGYLDWIGFDEGKRERLREALLEP